MIRLMLLTLSLLIISGCTFRKLEQDVSILSQMHPLQGEIVDTTEGKAPLLLLYLRVQDTGFTLSTFSLHPQAEIFNGLIGQGPEQLFVFKDLNGDYLYQAGEPAALSKPVIISPKDSLVPPVRLVLQSSDTLLCRNLPPMQLNPLDEASQSHWHKGTIITNPDSLFSPAHTKQSYWEPLAFIHQNRGGIFFNQPFDSTKIPVLYVHGAAGSPLDFTPLVAALDTTKYQAWFYYYPSGMPLYICTEVLHRLINALQVQQGFPTMIIVAHSMGGLVTRHYLNTRLHNRAFTVPLYITLSTPWTGHAGAQAGIDMAPAVVPSWIDMAPGSAFLSHLFDFSLPESTRHHLLFGVQGACNRYTGTNDGSVSIASQIAAPAQQEAIKIYGYDESHMSILTAPAVHLLVRQLLADQITP